MLSKVAKTVSVSIELGNYLDLMDNNYIDLEEMRKDCFEDWGKDNNLEALEYVNDYQDYFVNCLQNPAYKPSMDPYYERTADKYNDSDFHLVENEEEPIKRIFDDSGLLHSETEPAVDIGHCIVVLRNRSSLYINGIGKYWLHGEVMASESVWRSRVAAVKMRANIDSDVVVGDRKAKVSVL